MVNVEVAEQEEGGGGGDWEAELGSQRDVRVYFLYCVARRPSTTSIIIYNLPIGDDVDTREVMRCPAAADSLT